MPLKRDERGGGSNADGSRSALYCSHCCENGEFVLLEITVEQMQARVREKLIEFGFPGEPDFAGPIGNRSCNR